MERLFDIFEQLFTPDILTKDQYYPERPAQSGEQRLMLEVLNSAFIDLSLYRNAIEGRGKRIYQEAFDWITSLATAAFSFEMICESFDIDAGYLRRHALAICQPGSPDINLPKFKRRSPVISSHRYEPTN